MPRLNSFICNVTTQLIAIRQSGLRKGCRLRSTWRAIRSHSDLPKCPLNATASRRPNILMFGDFQWNESRCSEQLARYQSWLNQARRRPACRDRIRSRSCRPHSAHRMREARRRLNSRQSPRGRNARRRDLPAALRLGRHWQDRSIVGETKINDEVGQVSLDALVDASRNIGAQVYTKLRTAAREVPVNGDGGRQFLIDGPVL